jgi:PAS domain S-box-containing protein
MTTEAERMQAATASEGERLRRLAAAVNAAAESIIVTDAGSHIVYVNPAFERMTGFTSDEALGQHIRFLKSGKHDAAFYAAMWKVLHAGQSWHGCFVSRRKDGSLFEEEATISPVRDETGRVTQYVAVKRDITREQELEREVRQSQKLAALGQLSYRLTHNFTNTLLAILGNAEVAKRLKPGPDVLDHLNQITDRISRISKLTAQLMSFAQPTPPRARTVLLDRTIKGLEEILRRSTHAATEIRIEIVESFRVQADPAQIEQALIHLAINAFEAMPAGGTLTIRLSRGKLLDTEESDRHASGEWKPPRERDAAVLTVSDTGTGIAPEVQSRIFEPFFTTKQDRRNAGLGLSMVYNIVTRHGGQIAVSSTPGKGTTFTVSLPLAETPAPADQPAPAA